MGYSCGKLAVNRLFAIVDKDGSVLWSRGGSSTQPKLMVYDNEKSAERALKNSWTKQIIDESKVKIKKIYEVND